MTDNLISLKEAAERKIRFVRKPQWPKDYLEIPLLEEGGVGPWYTVHAPWAVDLPDMQDLVAQKVLFTLLDLDERAYLPHDPKLDREIHGKAADEDGVRLKW